MQGNSVKVKEMVRGVVHERDERGSRGDGRKSAGREGKYMVALMCREVWDWVKRE